MVGGYLIIDLDGKPAVEYNKLKLNNGKPILFKNVDTTTFGKVNCFGECHYYGLNDLYECSITYCDNSAGKAYALSYTISKSDINKKSIELVEG